MAKYYFGVNRGENLDKVVIGTSTTGKDIELVVDNTNVPDKLSVSLALEQLEGVVGAGNWPPA